ncbi:MAG: nucleotidyltransferase domain-containing protein [bacterium]|nr:nucleotidyltransferase domain-containing protein [bacterium]
MKVEVIKMSPGVKEAIKDLVSQLKKKSNGDLSLILLYGSSLTDSYSEEDSDIDILLVSKDDSIYDHILDIQTEVGLKYGVVFSILFDSPEGVREEVEAGSLFFKKILREGEVLYEDSREGIRSCLRSSG